MPSWITVATFWGIEGTNGKVSLENRNRSINRFPSSSHEEAGCEKLACLVSLALTRCRLSVPLLPLCGHPGRKASLLKLTLCLTSPTSCALCVCRVWIVPYRNRPRTGTVVFPRQPRLDRVNEGFFISFYITQQLCQAALVLAAADFCWVDKPFSVTLFMVCCWRFRFVVFAVTCQICF